MEAISKSIGLNFGIRRAKIHPPIIMPKLKTMVGFFLLKMCSILFDEINMSPFVILSF